jgi:hypothetical protein
MRYGPRTFREYLYAVILTIAAAVITSLVLK